LVPVWYEHKVDRISLEIGGEMRDRFILFALLGALSFQGTEVYGQLQEGGWPMVMRDARHTSRSPCVGPATSALKWAYDLGVGKGSWAWIVVDSSGVIYVPRGDSLLSMNPNGSLRWACGVRAKTTPAIGYDGTVYVGSAYAVHAIDHGGTEQWFYPTIGRIDRSSPVISSDGTVYIGCTDDTLHAVNPDGTRKWVYPTRGRVQCCPAIGSDETIYVGSYDDSLHAINPDGTRKWAFHGGGELWSSPAIGEDGTIYIGSAGQPETCCLFAVNPDGTERWTYAVTHWILSSPAIAPGGTIYIIGYDDTLHAVNADGTRKWARYLSGTTSDFAVDANGTVYIANKDLWAINADGTLKWCLENGSIWNSPAIGPDGTIYTASYAPSSPIPDSLYAIGPGQPIGDSRGYNSELKLSYSRPNPFNRSSMISYQVPVPGHTVLSIHDKTGCLVRTLLDGTKPVGEYAIEWDGKDEKGTDVSNGAYFYRLAMDGFVATRKAIVLQ
jgi:outer membrane protein assembly factor BamB